MKAERRQELRTNDLAQQIDQTVSYVKENSTRLAAIVLGVAVLFAGYFWYTSSRQNRVEDAWDKLATAPGATDAASQIRVFQEVANEGVTPALTIAAWLRVGDTAVSMILDPTRTGAGAATTEDWPRIAREAFEKVASLAGDDLTGMGRAIMGLGWVAESTGDFETARRQYRRLADDERFAGTPFESQAKLRLEGLDRWSTPITFPPPPPPPVVEGPQPQPSTTQPAMPDLSATAAPGSTPPVTTSPASATEAAPPPAGGASAPNPGSAANPEDSPPAATTQPAGGGAP